MSATERMVRLVLRLYPAAFRERYGDRLVADFSRMVELTRPRGRVAAARVWAGAFADLLGGVARERWRGDPPAWGSPRSRRAGGRERLGAWHRDMRYALRALASQPLFAFVATGSLAIGIGANTAVFSVANVLLIRPLSGIDNYDRVVELGRGRDGSGFDSFAFPDFTDIRDQIPALETAVPYTSELLSVSRSEGGVRLNGLFVGARYFDLLGVAPALGRYFVPEEDEDFERHSVTVVSHHFWTETLGADPSVIGSTLYLNRHPYEIVGVTPVGFQGHMVAMEPDIFVPITQLPMMSGRNEFESRSSVWHMALGLLAEDTTLDQLNSQLADLGRRLAAVYPESNARRTFSAMPLGPVPGAGRDAVRLFLGALLGMVAVILLVTCTNVAGMFLARATAREKEMSVRLALGAGRGALVRQLMVEALVVFLIGGGTGIALGVWTLGLLRPADLLPLPMPIRLSLAPDVWVMLYSALLTFGTGMFFGLLPALRATRVDVIGSLKEEGPGGARRSGRLRRLFAGSQVGLSLVLLVTAALFVRSLQRATSIDSGFDASDAYVTFIDLSLEGYDQASGRSFQQALLESLRGRGWVDAASISIDLPLDLSSFGTAVTPQGWEDGDRLLSVHHNQVSDGYFETLSIPLLAGRGISADDREGGQPVAVVSETFARRAWPDASPLGRTFLLGRPGPGTPRYTVVGVVPDVKNQLITETPEAFMYVPIAQRYAAGVHVVVRSPLAAPQAIENFRAVLDEADPMASRGAIAPLAEFTSVGILPQRIAAGLTSALAMLALLLSGLGIYGVISFAVGRQRREIGVRMALGADGRAVVGRVLRSGFMLALPGLLLGGAVSVVVANMLRTLLLDLSPYDPTALGTVALLLLGVVMVGSGIPARRAARIDPAESLRSE